MTPLYLDYNATTPVAPEVREALLPYLERRFGNPSSSHALGRPAREAVEEARARVAALLGAEPGEVYFTSGGTESNNLAIKGALWQRGSGHLVISAFEHPATEEPARHLQSQGFAVTRVRCSPQGVVDPDEVEEAVRPDTVLVSLMHANNEIGTLQPIQEISRRVRRHGVLLHTDAAQSVGKVPVGVEDLGVDLLSIAGHKLYAPKGIGALYVRSGAKLEKVLHGAGQEQGVRPGTENVAFDVALGAACSLAQGRLAQVGPRMAALRDRLLARLRDVIGSPLSVNGQGSERLPNTLSVNFPGVAGSELLGRAETLCASTGAACHAGETRMSATLAAIGLAPETARGTVRLSVGWYTTEDEIDQAADALLAAWKALVGQVS